MTNCGFEPLGLWPGFMPAGGCCCCLGNGVIEMLGVDPLDFEDFGGVDAAFVKEDKNEELAAAAAAAGLSIASFWA
jgi:hypothetical protein